MSVVETCKSFVSHLRCCRTGTTSQLGSGGRVGEVLSFSSASTLEWSIGTGRCVGLGYLSLRCIDPPWQQGVLIGACVCVCVCVCVSRVMDWVTKSAFWCLFGVLDLVLFYSLWVHLAGRLELLIWFWEQREESSISTIMVKTSPCTDFTFWCLHLIGCQTLWFEFASGRMSEPGDLSQTIVEEGGPEQETATPENGVIKSESLDEEEKLELQVSLEKSHLSYHCVHPFLSFWRYSEVCLSSCL